MSDERNEPMNEEESLRHLINELGGQSPRLTDGTYAVVPPVRLVPRNPVAKDETVVEFLRDLIRGIEAGTTDVSEGLIIHYLSSCGPKSSDGCRHHFWRYGLSAIQHLGLLTLAQSSVINEEAKQ